MKYLDTADLETRLFFALEHELEYGDHARELEKYLAHMRRQEGYERVAGWPYDSNRPFDSGWRWDSQPDYVVRWCVAHHVLRCLPDS